ncbi:MAG: porin family protein [Chitinophagaceae bacterium]
MKKLCVACLAFFSLISARAQTTSFGIKAGYNSSSVQVTNADDWDSKSGLHLGALAHIHITSHFAVQPELVYSCQGGEKTNTKLKLGYINLPVLLQYMISEGLRLQTGPQIGFLVSAKQKTGDVEVDVDDLLNAVDFSWSVGGGYLFSSGLGIDLRYNIGLNNISDQTNITAKNRVFQAGLFYQFNKTKTIKKK